MAENLQLLLARRPRGRATESDFEFRRSPVPSAGPGEALVENLSLSIDPSSRIWMNDQEGYLPPVALGEVMRGVAVGRVVASERPDLPVGSLVSGLFGWQQWLVLGPRGFTNRFSVLPAWAIPPSTFLGVLGATGLTAWFGMTEIGAPHAGETVVVSAAAGAVGSIAGQLAKLAGARVVGLCGGRAKADWLTGELGFDVAIDYKAPDWRAQLEAATSQGIDLDFENVGGEILDAILARINLKARIVLCGLISGYNATRPPPGPAHFSNLLIKRARLEGFIILDYSARFPEGMSALFDLVRSGRLLHRETVVEGLERAPSAINLIFDGANFGKLLVRIAP